MKMRALSLIALLLAAPAAAVPTDVVVRVISQGAKFVGTGMGGVNVVISDPTGTVLARGATSGGTGDTQRIMGGAPRGTPLAIGDAAAFRTTLDISAPVRLTVAIEGPLKPAGTAQRVSAEHWLIPGTKPSADGIVIELPGLAMAAKAEGRRVTASVSMMCGCPIAPGTLWDSSRFTVQAWRNGKAVPLAFAGQTGQFAGDVPAPGDYMITAHDAQTGASGAIPFTVRD
jgi:hypothetical protein